MLSVEERATRYVSKMAPAIQGEGGSTQAQKVCFKLVQGYALEPNDAAKVFKTAYNHKCVPPFSDKEILRKCNDALKRTPRDGRGFLLASKNQSECQRSHGAPNTKLTAPKAKPELYVVKQRAPTRDECFAIAHSRNLPGPGVLVAATCNTLRVGELFGLDVYGIGDTNGPLVTVRRIDGKPFPACNGRYPVKSMTAVSGAGNFHRPHGYLNAPGIRGFALCEGAPDYLALWEQTVWESSMDPTKLHDINHVQFKLTSQPLMMLSATSRIEPGSSYVDNFRGMSVLIVPLQDKQGRDGANQWFNVIKPVAGKVSTLICDRVRNNTTDDFNDIFGLITERVLPA